MEDAETERADGKKIEATKNLPAVVKVMLVLGAR
jgi:nitrate reductase NapAB chaperone NapD